VPIVEHIVCPDSNFSQEVLLLHGMTGSPDELYPAAQMIASSCNARVWLPRLKGHDTFAALRTVRAEEWQAQVLAVVEHIRQESSRQLTLIGISFGALLSLYAAQLMPAHIAKLVLLAPPWKIKGELQDMQLTLMSYLPEWMLDYTWTHKKESLDLALPRTCFSHHWIGAIARLGKVRRVIDPQHISTSTLILYDPLEHQVSAQGLEELAARMPHAKLVAIPDATHELLLGWRYQEVIQIITEYVRM
jgi:esterase/lipase